MSQYIVIKNNIKYKESTNILLEKEMAAHSSILAWRMLWTGEPGKIQSMGLQEADMT